MGVGQLKKADLYNGCGTCVCPVICSDKNVNCNRLLTDRDNS